MYSNYNVYVVNAFTRGPFSGNPAAYVPLSLWLPDSKLQTIAEQHNLSETVFTIPAEADGHYHIRWFTPTVEVDLCGHATLAAGHILFEELGVKNDQIQFYSKSGPLSIHRNQSQLTLNFPTDQIKEIELNIDFVNIFGVKPEVTYKGKNDLLLIYKEERDIISMKPNYISMSEISVRGVIVSAPSKEYDFISRGFFPASGIDEGPATGSAHTTLTPYWSKHLQKSKLSAKQCSMRGGYFTCVDKGLRTLISGQCQTYLKGQIYI